MAIALERPQKMQVVAITAAALGLYVLFRFIPTGTNLNHIDFRVTGSNALEFCDPSNPQFIPVVAVRSPVETRLAWDVPPSVGRESTLTLKLATANGKPIGVPDLLVAHTRRLHLLLVDPTLSDYQHVHPEPGARPGEWVFKHTPKLAGEYRVFADFTPAATGRGLYASSSFNVPGEVAVTAPNRSWTAEKDGYRFELTPDAPIRAGQTANLSFTTTRLDGGPVPLQPVMDAFAHLVAFDAARSGFAHLHPNEIDLTQLPDPTRPRLTFMITIPNPGLYVIWAQLNIGGLEEFVPFWFEVAL
jgi:hypothetical protein